jgi:hypothetical protein
MTFEDRQREAMTDFNRSSYAYVRELLVAGVKRAQDEADFQRFQLEEYERANGFVRTGNSMQKMHETLDASRAYREVTGRDAFAGAETYTRRNAEDIHD